MTYKQTLDYLYSQLPMFHRIGAAAYKPDLKNTIALCKLLHNPEKKFRSIHIAGTNGKGSTSHMLAAILQTAGYKTGLYTSPHLKDFRERIRINGKMIPKNEVILFVEKYRKQFEKIKPSFFEWTVGLCFDYFAREKVDIAIIETGLGGRLDSTNVVTPLLSIITNIGWDHTNLLGNTLEKIAMEKAGIIKPGVPVIIGEENKKIRDVLAQQAKRKKSKYYLPKISSSVTSFNLYKRQGNKMARGKLTYLIDLPDGSRWFAPLFDLQGNYQQKNIVPVIQAARSLQLSGYEIGTNDVAVALAEVSRLTGLRGRWEIISERPLTICDVAHNKDGLREVVKQLKATPHRHLHFVFGIVNDKDIIPMLKLLPKEATYYYCKAKIPRAMDAGELKQRAEKFKLRGNVYSSVKTALGAAQKNARKNDLVFVSGSTFVVAEAF